MPRKNKRKRGKARYEHSYEQQDDKLASFNELRTRNVKVQLKARNDAQEQYIEYLEDKNQRIVFAIGPAGTGKTYLAAQAAIQSLRDGDVDKIIITRPAVTADEKLGFLPGTLEQKMDPFLIPIFDIFEMYYTPAEIRGLMDDKLIEICPLAFMRGRNFRYSFILADEMQNSTPSQLKMLLTRISEGSRMVISGDISQHDRGYDENGLKDFLDRYKDDSDSIAIATFGKEHVERDPVVAEVLKIYGED